MAVFAQQKGRRDLFRREALPHLDSIYRTAVRRYSDPVLAQDLVQETFAEAWRSFHNYQPSSNCKAWLFKIFFRTAKRCQDREAGIRPVPLEDLPEQKLAEVSRFEEQVKQRIVLEILESLPKHYTTVLSLADVEGFSYREISDLLGLPIGTVMSRLNRARTLFREKFAGLTSKTRTA